MPGTVDAGQLESSLSLNILPYLAAMDKAVAVARAAEPLLNINATLGGRGGSSGLDAATRDLERYTAAQAEAQQTSASLRQEQVACTAATATQTETENTATQAVGRSSAARLAAAQSEAEFRQQRLASNLAASEAVARNSELQRSTEELTAAQREAMNAGRAGPAGPDTSHQQASAARQEEMAAQRDSLNLEQQLVSARRLSINGLDEEGRTLRVVSQERKNGTAAILASVTGYDEAGKKVTVFGERIVVTEATLAKMQEAQGLAGVSASAAANALGLEAREAEATGGSIFRLTGSENSHGNAMLRLTGPVGLLTAGVVILGGAAIKAASDFETAKVQVENFGNATDATNKKLESSLNNSFGTRTSSSTELLKSLAPIVGILAQLSDASDRAGQSVNVLRAGQELHVLTGEKEDATTRALVETERTFNLAAHDSESVEIALLDSRNRAGTSIEAEAKAYATLNSQLHEFKPSLAEVKAIEDASNAPGGGGTQSAQNLANVMKEVAARTGDAYEARQKYNLQVTDSQGSLRSLTDIEAQLGRVLQGKTADQQLAILAEFGVRDADEQTIQTLVELNAKQGQATQTGEDLRKKNDELAKATDTTAVAMDRLKAATLEYFKDVGGALATGGVKIIDWFNHLDERVGQLLIHIPLLQGVGEALIKAWGGSVGGPNAWMGGGSAVSPLSGIPLSGGNITQAFHATGQAGEPLVNGVPTHMGVDIATANIANTPVLASTGGKIVQIVEAEGKIVEDIGNGTQIIYQHLKPLEVALNQIVNTGQELGKVGPNQVGTSTGPHLHFEVQVNGQAVDPLAWLASHSGGTAGAGASAGAIGAGLVQGLPISALAAIYEHETQNLPLPSPATPTTAYGLHVLPGQASGEYSSGAGGQEGKRIRLANFTSPEEANQEEINTIKSLVPNWAQFGNDPAGLIRALGQSPYIKPGGDREGFSSQTVSLLGKPSQITPSLQGMAGGTSNGPEYGPGGNAAAYGYGPSSTSGSTPGGNRAPIYTPEELANAGRVAEQSLTSLQRITSEIARTSQFGTETVTADTLAQDQAKIDAAIAKRDALKPEVERLTQQEQGASPTEIKRIEEQLGPKRTALTEANTEVNQAQQDLKKHQDELQASTNGVGSAFATTTRLVENYNEALGKGTRVVNDDTIQSDKDLIESTKNTASEKVDVVTRMYEQLRDAAGSGDITGFNAIQSGLGPAESEASDAVERLRQAQSKLDSDLGDQRKNVAGLASEWENYRQTTIKVAQGADDQNGLVTQDMLHADEQRVENARNTALQQGQVVYDLIQQRLAAQGTASQEEIAQLDSQIATEQKLYNDDEKNYGEAQSKKTSDLKKFEAEQRAAADASRAFAQEEIANNQLIVSSLQAVGLQVPETWKGALEASKAVVADIHSTIQTLNTILSQPDSETFTPGDRAAFEQERKGQETRKTDAIATFNAELEASKQYSQAEEQLSKARLDQAKADRAADLTDVREKNAEKLASDLAAIQAGVEAQVASLSTSSEVSRIQAETYRAQAAVATDAVSQQKLLLQAQLAEQTASIQDNEAKQIEAVRNGEQEKLRQYNDILLQYQEATQTSAATQLQIQVDLEEAKANIAIASARIQMALQQEVIHGTDDVHDAEIQQLTDYISHIPDYIKSVNDSAVAWENYGTTVASGLQKAQSAITGLTQTSDSQVSKIQGGVQNQLALLQAQNQAQSTKLGLGAGAQNDPQTLALQRQIDQLTVIKDQQDLSNLAVNQQLAALQAQNGVLSAQITLQRDQQQASSTYLANTTATANLSLQRDQAELALLNVLSESQQAKLAGLKAQLDVLNSQNAVLQAQVQLLADQATATSAYLTLSTSLKTAAVQQDQTQLALLGAVSERQLQQLDASREQLAVLNSQTAVTQAQATFQNDQLLASASYLALSSQLKALAVERAQAEVSLLEQQNAAAQVQLTVEKQQLDAENAKLAVLNAQLKLSQDTTKASPEYLNLTGQLNQLHVQQDSLSTAGLKNAALDREVTMLEAQQKLLVTQNTQANTSLEAQRSIQTVVVDQLQVQQTQTQLLTVIVTQEQTRLTALDQQIALLQAQQQLQVAQGTLQGDGLARLQAQFKVQQDQLNIQIAQQSVITFTQAHLTLQAQILDRQTASLQAQQKLMQDQATVAGDQLSKEQAKAKVQTDQLTLQTAQASVISDAQKTLTLQVQTFDRQLASLQAQKKIMDDQNTVATAALSQQQAIAKVRVDELQVQQAQVTAQNAVVGGVNATLASLQAELALRQAIVKVQQSVTPTVPGGGGGGTGTFGNPGGGGGGGNNQPVPIGAPGTQYNPLPSSVVPSMTAVPGYQGLVTSGQYKGWVQTAVIKVNLNGKILTEAVLENLATGQTLDVNVV